MMNKEEFLKKIMELPKTETNNPISSMYGINVDDLMSAIDRLDQVPTYQDLLKENKKQKDVIEKLRKSLDECWYMDSEHVGEQVFLKKCELKDILKEVKE